MPPKKNTADATGDAGAEGAWKWTAENDRTLFLLSMGRGPLGKDDCEQMATALSSKTNGNAVRQRLGKFRAEQKKKYDDLGWEVPGTPVKGKAAPAGQKKRKGSDDEGDEVPETPSKAKKPRAKKVAKSEEKVVDEEEEEEEEGVQHGVVKEEEIDEAV